MNEINMYEKQPYCPITLGVSFLDNEKEIIMSNEKIKINEIIKNSTPSDLEKSVVEKMK